MLSLTRKTDYALLALAHLAQRPDDTVSAREISESFGLSQPLLMNVLKVLCSSGLLISTRGPRGGYSLAKPADQIRLDEIITTTEGPLKLAPCVNAADSDDGCDHSECCPLQGPLLWLHDKMIDFWSAITLAQLASAPNRPDKLSGQIQNMAKNLAEVEL